MAGSGLENNQCPNCQTEIKSGFVTDVRAIEKEKVVAANKILNKTVWGYCTKCFKKLSGTFKERKEEIRNFLVSRVNSIPIISLHCPLRWNYDVLGMVTAQAVLGTGAVAEVFSDFSDFFGGQSSAYQNKIATGENYCCKEVRRKTMMMGGNAIIGVDIDYGEAGAAKGMLMIVVTGTAIVLKNPEEVLSAQQCKMLAEIEQKREPLQLLSLLNEN